MWHGKSLSHRVSRTGDKLDNPGRLKPELSQSTVHQDVALQYPCCVAQKDVAQICSTRRGTGSHDLIFTACSILVSSGAGTSNTDSVKILFKVRKIHGTRPTGISVGALVPTRHVPCVA